MPSDFLHPGGIVSMTKQAVERLLSKKDGSLALLYLSLLAHGNDKAMQFASEADRQDAYKALASIGLWDSKKQPEVESKEEKIDAAPPDYTQNDVVHALEEEQSFSALVEQIQQMLGKKLSTPDLRHLLFIFDYLAFPPEVIMLLTNFCIEQTKKKFGEGRRPTLSQIKKEALYWSKQGVETLDQAEIQLKKAEKQKEWEQQVLHCVGVRNRVAVSDEKRYIKTWGDMGFTKEVLVLAYERTVLHLQNMNWQYMNAILRRWHKEGLMTKSAIEAKEAKPYPTGDMPYKPNAESNKPKQKTQDFDRLDQLLGKQKGE